MKIIVTADDYGRSKSITDHILKCIDEGVINNVNIVANGYAFDYAIGEYKKRPDLDISVHLDLVEGKPISSLKKVDLLINDYGEFKNSFPSLWLEYLLSFSKRKRELRSQIKNELRAQIKRVTGNLNKNTKICLNSHQHLHLIPFVFDILVELKKEVPNSYIRLTNEPFFLSVKSFGMLKNYFGPNIVKHVLLKYLSRQYRKVLKENNIDFVSHFVGVLFTGNSSALSTKAALVKLPLLKDDDIVEILFHPCVAGMGEEKYWKNDKAMMHYYYSPDRKKEFKVVRSSELKRIIEDFKNRNNII